MRSYLLCQLPRTHPDKLVNPTDAQRKAATEEFQVILCGSHRERARLNPPHFHRLSQTHTSSSQIPCAGSSMTPSMRPKVPAMEPLIQMHLRGGRTCLGLGARRTVPLMLDSGPTLTMCLPMFLTRYGLGVLVSSSITGPRSCPW